MRKIECYAEEVFNLYCPRLHRSFGNAAITSGLLFPCADDRKLRDEIEPMMRHLRSRGRNRNDYYRVAGRATIENMEIEKVFPLHAEGPQGT